MNLVCRVILVLFAALIIAASAHCQSPQRVKPFDITERKPVNYTVYAGGEVSGFLMEWERATYSSLSISGMDFGPFISGEISFAFKDKKGKNESINLGLSAGYVISRLDISSSNSKVIPSYLVIMPYISLGNSFGIYLGVSNYWRVGYRSELTGWDYRYLSEECFSKYTVAPELGLFFVTGRIKWSLALEYFFVGRLDKQALEYYSMQQFKTKSSHIYSLKLRADILLFGNGMK